MAYLASIGRFERNVKLVLTGTLARGMAIGLLGTVFNLYLYSLGFSRPFIGLVNGAQALATLLVSLPLGYVADRWGRKPVLVLGAVAYPAAILGLTAARLPVLMILLSFTFGLAATAYWVSAVPMLVANSRPEDRVRVFSVNSFLLWGIGPFGALLGGVVAQIAAPILHVQADSAPALRVALYAMACLAVFGAVPFMFLTEHRVPAEARVRVAVRKYLGLFVRLMLPDAALAMGAGSVLTFVQLYFRLRFGLAPGAIGAVIGSGGIAGGLGTLLAPLPSRRWGNLLSSVRLQTVSAPLMLVLALAPWVGLAIPAFWLLMASARMMDPIYTAFAQEQVPDALRARLSGLYSVTYAIGFGIGPTVSGFLQSVGGFTLAFVYGMSCYLAGACLLFLFFGRRSRPAPTPLT